MSVPEFVVTVDVGDERPFVVSVAGDEVTTLAEGPSGDRVLYALERSLQLAAQARATERRERAQAQRDERARPSS